MFTLLIDTSAHIQSPATEVWKHLVKLSDYHKWNPMVVEASGEVKKGERIKLHFNPKGNRGMHFQPVISSLIKDRELKWTGKPELKFIIESEHVFELLDDPEGGTRLKHYMVFEGLLIPLVGRIIKTITQQAFEDFNRALKDVSEA